MTDDLFRFLQVRPVQALRGAERVGVIRYTFFEDSANTTLAEAPDEDLGSDRTEAHEQAEGRPVPEPIRGNLVQAIGRHASQDEVERAIANWIGRDRAEATFHRLQRLADALGALSAGEPNDVPVLAERQVVSLAIFAWDLLLMAYRERDSSRKEILTGALRYLFALHGLGFPEQPPEPPAFAPWLNATVAVPKWFVPPASERSVDSSPLPPTPAPDTAGLQRIAKARLELDGAIRSQGSGGQVQTQGDGDETEMGARAFGAFEEQSARARQLAADAGVELQPGADLASVESALVKAQRLMFLQIQPVRRPENQIVVLGSKALPLDQICAPSVDIDPCAQTEHRPWPGTYRQLMPVGIGDLMVVRRQVDRYEMGLVADIESVPPGHKRVRTHRSLERSESETELSSSIETTREQEHQVEESEKLSSASRREQERQNQTKAGVELSAKYGAVKMSASASYASKSAKKVANESAREYAKQTVDKALENVREQRSSRSLRRMLRETEETNVDSLENDGNKPSVSIFRWVDRYDTAEIVNIGQRLIYEASIPEPAAFYIYSQIVDSSRDSVVDMPVAPHQTEPVLGLALNGPQDLDDQNYVLWARLYGATGIEPPPTKWIDVSVGANGSEQKALYRTESISVSVPAGYQVVQAHNALSFSQGQDRYMNLWVGTHKTPGNQDNPRIESMSIGGLHGEIPILLQGYFSYYGAQVTLICRRTDAAFAAWQAATYDQLLIAYQQRKEAAESEVDRLRARGGVADIRGLHPEENLRIVRTELKKSFLELLTGQRFGSFDAMKSNVGALRYPEFDFKQAEEEGRIVDFFERAFEWSEATFIFREYFVGRKRNWVSMVNLQDPDPLFAEFLRAGKARYAVPVSPGFENAVAHYMTTGEVFLGGDLPTIDDELYISIAEELRRRDTVAESDPIASWEIKAPTSLVMIDPSGQLPSF